jgi:hypothetical protein
LKVAPFAKLTLASIDAADPNKPTVQPVPYVGVQYAASRNSRASAPPSASNFRRHYPDHRPWTRRWPPRNRQPSAK